MECFGSFHCLIAEQYLSVLHRPEVPMAEFAWQDRAFVGFAIVALTACGSAGDSTAAPATQTEVPTAPPSVAKPNAAQAATVGATFDYDASQSNSTFTDPRGRGLTYSISLSPPIGLTTSATHIVGVPTAPAVVTALVTATDALGRTAVDSFSVVVFSGGLKTPTLPSLGFAYSDADVPLPLHFVGPGAPGGSVIGTDNTPLTNQTTNTGAALGRVLFYDTRLSGNDRESCSSCHQQQFAFGDTARLSRGFDGGSTKRHAMGLANARFYQRGHFFWDERAATLEAQVLMPIQDGTEMGMTLPHLVTKLSATPFYASLFQAAFGSSEITSDRISRALAQFVRSMTSAQSKFDRAFAGAGPPNFAGVLTPDEALGQQLFVGRGGCAACHATAAQVSDDIHNNGLDATPTDTGAGGARFKAPSLRNIAVRPPYMHDGRFTTLDEVVAHYDNGVQNSPNLDRRLRGPNGQPQRLGLSVAERAALVAYMRTLTDSTFLTAAKYSDPFRP
jgi:cytochrome c peroxidase